MGEAGVGVACFFTSSVDFLYVDLIMNENSFSFCRFTIPSFSNKRKEPHLIRLASMMNQVEFCRFHLFGNWLA
jgi:hypothetical protein